MASFLTNLGQKHKNKQGMTIRDANFHESSRVEYQTPAPDLYL